MKSMKKQYVKPELYFENFQLSTSIATCDTITKRLSPGTCGYYDGVQVIFTQNVNDCAYKTGDSYSDMLCYDVFNGANNNLFNS